MLDPVADRLVLVTAVIAIAVYGAVPGLARRPSCSAASWLVSVAVLVLAALGAKRIDVLWVGKAGTFGLFCCFPLFLLGDERRNLGSCAHRRDLGGGRAGADLQLR